MKEWRKAKGLTLQSLGESVDIDHGTLSKLERGFRRWNLEQLVRVAEALDVELFMLFIDPNDPIGKIHDEIRRIPLGARDTVVEVIRAIADTPIISDPNEEVAPDSQKQKSGL
ncbi:helix-turn-helix domain-containing protein [Rhodobacteraceae bacterium RKSG542]|uniref:helix-turn-helix domain-containing protein n=1 Tax=Pseudovibrio flavus TaxID=2529854 RepID=UPI0012BD3D4F|nr:helix-turn-helix domain-containing protein [Pseudovibrio flavus]MTI18492.1 helix-turn-helix domain-containing protein [Pseudovibrio flavus]